VLKKKPKNDYSMLLVSATEHLKLEFQWYICSLTPKGPKAIFKPFLKFGQDIVKAIFIKIS
jgi:hypothetical protein